MLHCVKSRFSAIPAQGAGRDGRKDAARLKEKKYRWTTDSMARLKHRTVEPIL
jgi:hypothetical protein